MNFPQNQSVSRKLILGGLTIILIPFFIAGTIIYFQLSGSLLDLSKEESLHVAQNLSLAINERLVQEIKFVSAIAADPDFVKYSESENFDMIQSKLENVYDRIGDKYFTFFVVDKNGIDRADAVFKHQIGLDLSDREYFKKAKVERKASVAGPLISRGSSFDSPIIIVCAPIHDSNDFYGAIAIVFSSDLFVKIISKHNVNQDGQVFIINPDGLIVAHPQRELILRESLFKQPGREEIRRLVADKEDGVANYQSDGSEMIAALSKIALVPWVVAYAMEKEDIIWPMRKIIYSIFISGSIFLLLTMLSIIFFSKRLGTPIQRLLEIQKQIWQYSTETILYIGLDRRIQFANPSFEKITEMGAKNIIGTEPCLENVNNLEPSQIWKVLESGKSWSGRIILKKNELVPITLEVMQMPLRDHLGIIQGYIQIGRDITTELMFERRLQQSQKLEAIGTLAGGVAHDFNNILSVILGYSDLVLLKCEPDELTQEYVEQIKAASERARDLVNQILTFSRKSDIELRALLPKIVLKEAIKLIRASTPAHVDIKSEIHSDSMIKAEATQLHQIVLNLVTNAVHALGDRGGRVTISLEDFYVEEGFTKVHPGIQQGRHIKLSVSDTGCGMRREILDHIFEPFFTTKPHNRGTGLGLSVVHGLVKQFSGIITVYSEPGEGTVFHIIIPCTEIENNELNSKQNSIKEGFERVVLIDDEISVILPLQAILEDVGYTVTTFSNSVEAVKTIEKNPENIDIIVSDHSMPQMSGLDVAKRLRAGDINIPIILISGFLEETTETRARQLGINEFVSKPFSSYQITDAIRRIMEIQLPDRHNSNDSVTNSV